MGDFKEDYLLSRQEYGVLFPYIAKDDVKQIFWNGRNLCIESSQGISIVKERLSDVFMERFSLLICNSIGKSFNIEKPVFEYENKSLYIQMIHKSVAGAGATLLIRKKERPMRPDARSLIESGFCDESVIGLLKDIISEEVSFLIYGHRDVDKLMRFMTRYIPPESRMVCIGEDTKLDIATLNPDKDVTEIRVNPDKVDNRLMRICRGINPRWILSDSVDGRVVRGIVQMMDAGDVRGGICVNRYDEDEMVESMFPWEYERKVGRIKQTLLRVFPIRIGVDKSGIFSIVHYDRNVKNMLFERSSA